MLKKIIDQTKKASFTFVNISLGLATIIAVLIIASWQVFVDSAYRPIALSKFFNIKFLKRTIGDLRNKGSLCFGNIKMIVYQKDKVIFLNNNNEPEQTITLEKNETRESKFFINKAKNEIAFLTQNDSQYFINIFSLIDGQLSRIPLEEAIVNVDIINFDGLDNVYLTYRKQKEWLIVRIEGRKIVPIINDISYDGERLTQSTDPIKDLIVYPECFSQCHFIIFNIKEGSKKEIAIANEENNSTITEVILYYFDEDNEKIIYQIPKKKTVYIADFSAYLWHHILLEPTSGNLLAIQGVLRDSRGVKKLIAFSKTRKQAYTYDINYIGLNVIDLQEGYEVAENQISLPNSCLLLQNNERKKFLIQDIESQLTKPITQEAEDVQLF